MEVDDILPNLTTPKGLELRESAIQEGELGIWCVSRIPKGDKFGPFEGTKVFNSKQTLNPQYAWEVLDPETGKFLYYIDASDETKANWMRFVRCARYFEEQNIVSKQEGCDVYYAAINDIEPGEELLTWYDMTEYNESLKKKVNKKNVKKKTETVDEVPPSPSKTARGKGKSKTMDQTSEDGAEHEEKAKTTKKTGKQKDYAESAENDESEKSDSCEGHVSDSNNEKVDGLSELTENSLDNASKRKGKGNDDVSAENELKDSGKVVIGRKRGPRKKSRPADEKVTERSENVDEEVEKMESLEVQKSEIVGELGRDFSETVSKDVKCSEKVVIRNKRGPKKKSKLGESDSLDIADSVNGDSSERTEVSSEKPEASSEKTEVRPEKTEVSSEEPEVSSEKTEVSSEKTEVGSERGEEVLVDQNGDASVNGEERKQKTWDKDIDACENGKDSANIIDKEAVDCSDVSDNEAKDIGGKEDVTLSSSPDVDADEDNSVVDSVTKSLGDKKDVTLSSSQSTDEDNSVDESVAKNVGDKKDVTLSSSQDTDEDNSVAKNDKKDVTLSSSRDTDEDISVAKNVGDKKDVTLSSSQSTDEDKNGKDVTLEQKDRVGIPVDMTCNSKEIKGDEIEDEVAGDGSIELGMDISKCPDDVNKSDAMDSDSGVDADESGKNANSRSDVHSADKAEEILAESCLYLNAKEAESIENITPDKTTESNDLVADLRKTSENGCSDVDHRLVNTDGSLLVDQDVQSDGPLNLSMKSEYTEEEGEKKLKPYALGQLESMTNAFPKFSTGEEKFGSSILRAAFAGQKITTDVPHKPVRSPQGSISPGPMSPSKLGLTGTKSGIVFHNLTPELVEQNLYKNTRCSYGRYTPIGRGVTQFLTSSPKVPKPEPVLKKAVGTVLSNSPKDTAKPDSLQKPDGQYYQFEIQSHHHCIENGRQIYRCDVCSGSYRHAFSLKRHFIRNHVNHKYVSDADLINCCVNIKKPTEQTPTESKKICDMIRSAGYENEPDHDKQGSDTKTEINQPSKLESGKDATNLESEIVNELPNISNPSGNEQNSAPGDETASGDKKENVIILSRASEDTDGLPKLNDNLVILQSPPKKWPGLFRCNACGATFDELPLLTTHYLNHPSKKEGRMFTCDKCFMKFSHKHNLIRHRSSHQISSSASKHSTVSIRGVAEGQQGEPIYQCKLCPAFFLHRGYLMKHIRVMHGRQRNACAFCSKHFENEAKLEAHLRITHDQSLEANKTTMLKNCPKTPTDLDKNQSMKLSNRAQGYRFACTVCKKRFKEYRIMCRHRRLAHQGGRTPPLPEKSPRVELVIPTPKRSLFVEDSPFFYANVAKNISDNLNMHVDGKIESLGNPSVHFRVKDGAVGPNSCDMKLPESDFWVKYNVNPEFPLKLNFASVIPGASDQSQPQDVRPENMFVASQCSGMPWPCTAECNQRRRKNGFRNFYADDNEDKKYICMICKKEFEFFMDFDDHRWDIHPSVDCTHMEVDKESYPPIFVPPTFHGMLSATPSDGEKVYPSSYKCTKCNSTFDLIDKLHEHIVSCAVKGKRDETSSSSNSNLNGYGSKLLGDYKKNQYAQMKKGFKVKHRLQHRAQLKSLAAQKAKEEKLQNNIKKQRKSRYEREQGIGYNDRGFEFSEERELNEDGTQKRRKFFQLPYNPKKHKRRRDMTQVVDMHMCGGCRKRFKTLGLLERHGRICSEKEKLNKAEAIAVPKREITGALKCKYCAKVFTYKASLRKHLMDICRVKKDLIARNILSPTELEDEKIMIDNMAEKTYDGQESVHSSEVGSEMTNEPEEDLMLPRRIGYWRGKKRKGRKKNNRWAKIKIPKKPSSTDSKEGAEDDSKMLVEESMALGESAGTMTLELLKSQTEVKTMKGRRTFKRRKPLVGRGYRIITEFVPDGLLASTAGEDGAGDNGKRRRKRTFKAQEQANIEMVLDDMECYIEDDGAPKKKKRRKLKPGMEGSNSGSFSSSLDGSVSVTVPLDRVAPVAVAVPPKVRRRPGPKKGWKLAKLQAKFGEISPSVTEEESKSKMHDLEKADVKSKQAADDTTLSPSAPAVVKKRPGPKKGWKQEKMKLLAKTQSSDPDVAADNPPTDVGKSASVLAQEDKEDTMEKPPVVERVRGKPGPKKGWKLAKLGLPRQSPEDAATTGAVSETDTTAVSKPAVLRRKPKGSKPRFQAKKYIASVVGEILDEAVPSVIARKKTKRKRGPLPKGEKIAKGVKNNQGETSAPTSEITSGAVEDAKNAPTNSEPNSNDIVPVVTRKPRGPKKGWKLERARAAELAKSLLETAPEPLPEPAPISVAETIPEKPGRRKPGPKKGWKLLKKEQESEAPSSGTGRGRKSNVVSCSPTRKNSRSPNRKVSPSPTRKEVTDLSPEASSNSTGKVAVRGERKGKRVGKVAAKRGRKAAADPPDSPEKRVLLERGPGKRVVKIKKAVLAPPTRGRKRAIKDVDTKAKTLVKRRKIDGMEKEGLESDETLTEPPSGLVLNDMDHIDGVETSLVLKNKSGDSVDKLDLSACVSDLPLAECASSSGVSSGATSDNSFETGANVNSSVLIPNSVSELELQ